MRCNILHLDNALKRQPRFLEACRALQAQEVEAEALAAPVRLWGKEPSLHALEEHLSTALRPHG